MGTEKVLALIGIMVLLVIAFVTNIKLKNSKETEETISTQEEDAW